MNNKTPMKQTHLDFHTSPDIEGIGSKFSKENFQAALKKGKLDSITVFAKCHHGHCYYPTEVSTMHPHLDFDLTGAMVDAAHEVGVRAPIYLTAGWSDLDAIEHPEWVLRDREGNMCVTGGYDLGASADTPKGHVAWHHMCLNDVGGYAEHIYALTEEVCKRYKDVDGIFYDICIIGETCYCDLCKKSMMEMGLDPKNEADVKKHFSIKRRAFMQKCIDIIKKYHPEATYFFNSGGANPKRTEYHEYQTHFEMEDLPTAWGGYDQLPLRSKYFKNSGKGILAMTGKFHLAWGEFGGFKPKEALKFEIAMMGLYGVGASVGDHMHPDGEMEMQTYENIGYAYDYLEQIAPYCFDGDMVVNLGLYLGADWRANEGVSKILIENQIDYAVVANNNFDKFDTVIVSAGAKMDEITLAAFQAFIDKGGKVLLMADALVQDGKFMIDTGLEYLGAPEFDCDYLMTDENWEDVPNAPMLCNHPGHRTKHVDAQVIAEIMTPYFSRTYAHFCGHKNTPHNKAAVRMPGMAKKGNIVYLAHALSKQYDGYGCIYHKRYFMHALGLVYGGAPLCVKGLGSQGRCTAIEQKQNSRYCINLLYAAPHRRGEAEIIEDILPVYNIEITLATDKAIQKVYNALTGEVLAFTKQADGIAFTLPKLECHASIVCEY